MNDVTKTMAALQRAARDGSAAAVPQGYGTPEEGAGLILAEVAQTMLPRRLRVVFDEGVADMRCDAASRRLVRLVPPAPMHVDEMDAEFFDDGVLTASDRSNAAAALIAVCKGFRSLRIEAEPAGTEIDPAEGGIRPETVAELLGIADLAPPTPLDPDLGAMDRMIAALESRIRAALWIADEEVSVLLGEGAEVDALLDWAPGLMEQLLEPGFPLASSLETDGILTFGLPPEAGCHRIVAGRLGQVLVATVAGSDPLASLREWRAARQG